MKLKLALLAPVIFSFLSSFAQLKPEDLNIDTSLTGFHFAVDFQGTLVFTKNGSPDINTINPTAFSFTIVPNMSSAMAKEQLDMLLNMSRQNGYEITDLVQTDTTLKGNSAYYTSYTETDSRTYKNFVFNAFVIKDNTLILFTSGDLDDGQYVDRFKKTFYNIKL